MQKAETIDERIARVAFDLIMSQGIKKTTMEEVAQAAGVTRVTVYRHFQDKAHLVRAAFRQVTCVFEEIRESLTNHSWQDAHTFFEHIEDKFQCLPAGDVPARSHELRILYPDIYQELHATRLATLSAMFEYFFDLAERQQLLRPGVRRKIVQFVFWEVIVNLLENPRMAGLGFSAQELHRAVRDIFLYGILKQEQGSSFRNDQSPT